MPHTLVDLNRNDLIFNQPDVDTVLPSHFQEQYPTFVTLLKKYYDWLQDYTDSDGRNPIGELEDIAYLKDRELTPERFLEFIFDELSSGIGPDAFPESTSRFFIKLLPFFYKTRGTQVSAEGFLKFLYGENVQLSYPKDQTFIVGESQIGAESVKFLQDSYYYQIYSVLVTSAIPIATWKNLYKTYIHPAGWELFSELVIESLTTNTSLAASMPLSIDDSAPIILANILAVEIGTVSSKANVTIVDSAISTRMYAPGEYSYYNTSESILDDSPYNQYSTLVGPLETNSRLFSSTDDVTSIKFNLSNSDGTHTLDDDSAGTIFTLDRLDVFKTIDFSNIIETMDESEFDYYPDSGADTP
jgi:hypothetical protein